MNTPTTAPTDNNALDSVLRDLKRGAVSRQANEAFTDLVKSVRHHGKGGDLTLKVTVKPSTGSDASRVTISASVAVKAPASVPQSAIYFTNEEGAVSKHDFEQDELPGIRPLASAEPAPATPQPAVAATI